MLTDRTSGVLLHPTSLANAYPIGDIGPAADEFIDFLFRAKQRWWQMLPVGPPGHGDSPYQARSAFAGNPLLISPDRLVEQGLLHPADLKRRGACHKEAVNFSAAIRLKGQWLKRAYEQFERQSHGRAALEAFVHDQAFWLADYALFAALEEREATADWTQWPPDLRHRRPASLAAARRELAPAIRFHQFVQWQFDRQWRALRASCLAKGIVLIGDVPIFVAHHSADVWAHPEIFKLDPDGQPKVVAGVPPDYFSETGQVWGLPVYRWDVLERQHYRWWIDRLHVSFKRFDVLRLDHFIGFVRTYEVPADEKTAVNGYYHAGPGASFFNAIQSHLGPVSFIAEDLGVVTPEVETLREQLKVPGMRILQFEFKPEQKGSACLPDRFPVHSVIYTGTHDNDTTMGWYRKLETAHRQELKSLLGTNEQGIPWGMIGVALESDATTVITPAQDLLALGSRARMNIPGMAHNNWRWRLKAGALTPGLAQRLKIACEQSRRLPSHAAKTSRIAALFRILVPIFFGLITSACETPSQYVAGPGQFLAGHQKPAMEAALDRARLFGHCPKPEGAIESQEMVVPPLARGENVQSGVRATYRIRVSGCAQDLHYTVTCPEGDGHCTAGDAKAN